jgi:hypothetical protein
MGLMDTVNLYATEWDGEREREALACASRASARD